MSVTSKIPLIPQESWFKNGLCKLEDNHDIFFPQRGESTRAGKTICRMCPVNEDCLDFSVVNEQSHGIFGGVMPKNRELLRQKSSRAFDA